MFSRFFIDRPIFSMVIAVAMVLIGLLTVKTLPVAQFPDITLRQSMSWPPIPVPMPQRLPQP